MTLKNRLLATSVAYDNSAGWKLDADGKIEMKDGNPVYVDTSGREMTIRYDTIATVNAESKANREAREAAEKKLKDFEGLDPKIARDAVETIKKIDAKTLIDAGKVDEVKAQIQGEYQKTIGEKDKALETLQARIDNMQVNSIFSQSDFVRDAVAVPRDMFEATFRSNFKVEAGKIVAYDRSGNVLMSKQNIGEIASPDEALKLLVEMHPQKDVILRADVGSGSGSDGSGSHRGTGRVIKRAEFDALAPAKKAEVASKVSAGEMKLVD
jgi:hypothetical protein